MKKIFAEVEQGSEKTSNSVLVIVKSKAKEDATKWMSTSYGKEVVIIAKVEFLTTFVPHDLISKTECTEVLESFLTRELQEQGAMTMNNLKIYVITQ